MKIRRICSILTALMILHCCAFALLLPIQTTTAQFEDVPLVDVAFDTANVPEPVPPPDVIRNFFELDPFYQQWINVGGLPVLASAQVNPYAIKEAAYLIGQMIGHRRDVLRAMAANKARFSVIGHTEIITEIPEYHSDPRPDFLVFHERGWGGSEGATVSSSDENILNYPGTYGGPWDSVLIHEFAHGIHLLGLNKMDPTFDVRLKKAYDTAIKKGLWQGTYASSDRREYWAEATQAWFNPKGPSSFRDFGNTRRALKAYDPEIAILLAEVYGDRQWRYTPVATRTQLPHLQGFDPQASPIFEGFPELEAVYRQLRDSNSDGEGAWVNLKAYRPNQLPRLTHANAHGGLTTVIFVNFSQADVLVYWVEPDGTEGYWTRVPPGYVRGTPSRINQIWLVKDANSRNLTVFQAEEKTGRAGVGAAPHKPTRVVQGDSQPQVLVEIPDKNLAKAVRTALKLGPNAPITDTALETLTHLDVRDKKIKNLTGLEHAKALKTLDLDENEITNVRPLAGLKQLEWLLIGGGGNKIGDTGVRHLSDLTRLKGLSLYRNQIGNITSLAKLTKLDSLWLDSNEIRDISALSKLVNLRTLHLRDNKIRDVSPLAKLTKLESLRLAGNPIQDTAPLQKLLKRNPDMELDIEVVGVGAAPTAVAERPAETALLANFPNPFNPETWIPYQLATDTDVKITIYNTQGVVVRTLALGHQSAGYYTGREHAAYWDGRNALGEPVASGLYFYTFTAGEFTATRKMLIRK